MAWARTGYSSRNLDDEEATGRVLASPASSNIQQSSPVIDGDLVVWLEGYSIHYTYIENGCPATQACINHTAALPPAARPVDIAVSGTKIVYEDRRKGGNDRDIFVYDLSTGQETAVATGAGNQTAPDIDGNWVVWDSGSGSSDTIYAVHLELPQEVIAVSADDGSVVQDRPAISGTTVVWNQGYIGQPEAVGIWMRVLSNSAGPRRVSSMEGSSCDIDEDIAVWASSTRGGAKAKVILYNLSSDTMKEATKGTGSVYHPAISGERIVWTDDRNSPRNIYENRFSLTQTLADKYYPILHVFYDDYVPVKVDMMTDMPGAKLRDLNNEGWKQPVTIGSLGDYNQSNYPDSRFYLDQKYGKDEDAMQNKSYLDFRENEHEAYPPTMYARVVPGQVDGDGNSKTVIQYWFCYYYNDAAGAADQQPFDHEGEWEMVQVILDENLNPEGTVYSQHYGGTEREWAGVDHPMVYVAKGTHASYHTSGTHFHYSNEIDFDTLIYDVSPSIDDELTDEWDNTQGDHPDIQVVDEGITSWLGFDGWWGEIWRDGEDVKGAPQGPPLNLGKDGVNKWVDPLGWWQGKKDTGWLNDLWANAQRTVSTPGLPLLTEIIDSLGRRVGINADGSLSQEIPGSESISWSDGAGTAIVADSDIGDGYTIRVQSQDSLPFSFEVNLPFRSEDRVDKLSYDVNVATPVVAAVYIAPEGSPQDYTMHLDTDGDGQFDDGTVSPATDALEVDFTPPAQIGDLSGISAGPGAAELGWTASGDDGQTGQAAEYEIRYSASPIVDESSWIMATDAIDAPAPQPVGSSEAIRIEGLASGSYYFAVRAVDETGQIAAISNSVQVQVSPFSFTDDFSDGNSDGWQEQEPGDWSVVDAGSNWLYRASSLGMAASWTGPLALRDQTIEADVQYTDGTYTCGLTFRGEGDISSGSYYYFGIYPYENKWRLYSVNGGDWGDVESPLGQGDLSLSPDTIYRLKAVAQGDNVMLYFNGQPLTAQPVESDDHPWGKAGLWMAMGESEFDDIVVSGS